MQTLDIKIHRAYEEKLIHEDIENGETTIEAIPCWDVYFNSIHIGRSYNENPTMEVALELNEVFANKKTIGI